MRLQKHLHSLLIYMLLLAGSLFCLLPFYWLLRSSLMEMSQIFEYPPVWLPSPIRWRNYTEALTILPFDRYFWNTAIIVLLSVAGASLSSAVCAYSFARIRWKGRDFVFGLVLSSMMLPSAVTLIPTFIGWKSVHALNTFVPIIVPEWFGVPFFIFLLRQFYFSIPKELDEAAFVDGANHFRIFWQIVLPLVKPALAVVCLFSFLNSWNDFLKPLIYLNDDKLYTVAIGLAQFKGLYNAQWHLMMAAATVVIMPAIVVFLFGQKYFIEGITLTGLKG